MAKAIAHAKLSNATLVVAKLDRLARNVAFTVALMESKVDFVCCDCKGANTLTLHILAAIAQEEARLIGQRTKKALAAAKAAQRPTRLQATGALDRQAERMGGGGGKVGHVSSPADGQSLREHIANHEAAAGRWQDSR